MVLEKIIIPEIQKVSGNVEKKICAVGITKLLTECPPMMDTEYTKLWQVLHSKVLGNYSFLSCDCKIRQAYFLEGQENLVLILASPLATNHQVQDMTCVDPSGPKMILFPDS